MLPLSGITVLDLTRVLSGPYCTMMLGDLGARVIKIERPHVGDDTRAWGPPFVGGESTYFLSVNRNKESLTLDFQQPEGRAILEQLIARADVFVENFRTGTLAKYGFDYASLADRFPHLVYCSISGYGQTGPRRTRAGYDAVIQAEAGLMSVTGEPDGQPFRLGVAITDIVSGMFGAQGITAALLARTHSGRGQLVDVSLFDSAAALLTYHASAYLATGALPPRFGNGHLSIVPYDTYRVRDGLLMVAVGNDDQWRRLCDVAELGDAANDARFATNPQRVEHRAGLQPILERAFLTRDRDDWIDRLDRAGVPCGAVRTVSETLADPQLDARGMIASLPHHTAGPIRVVNSPILMSGGGRHSDRPPPALGEHTEAILTTELGLSTDDVRALRARQVV